MIFKIPAGVVPDNIGIGVGATYALAQNLNAFAPNLALENSGSSTAFTLLAAVIAEGVILRQGSASGAVTDTTDTAANILAAFPNTIPNSEPFQKVVRIVNQTGQAYTLQGGTGVTVSGTATIANADWRDFLMVLSGGRQAPAVVMYNIGGGVA